MARGAPKSRGKKSSSPESEAVQSTLAFGQAVKPAVAAAAASASTTDDVDADPDAYLKILAAASTQLPVAALVTTTATRTSPPSTLKDVPPKPLPPTPAPDGDLKPAALVALKPAALVALKPAALGSGTTPITLDSDASSVELSPVASEPETVYPRPFPPHVWDNLPRPHRHSRWGQPVLNFQ